MSIQSITTWALAVKKYKISSDSCSAAGAGVGAPEPRPYAVLVELVRAAQLHPAASFFLADCAFRRQWGGPLQFAVLLFVDRGLAVLVARQSKKSEDGNGRDRQERHRESSLKEVYSYDRWFLLDLLFQLRLWLCLGQCLSGYIIGDVLCGAILVPHFFKCIWFAELALESGFG